MTKLVKAIASAFGVGTDKTAYRFSRGMGPHPAPKRRPAPKSRR